MKEPLLRGVGEFWGLLCALFTVYIWGFDNHYWQGLWLGEFVFCLALIFRAYKTARPNQVNLSFVMVAILILSFFCRLVGSMMHTGMLFLCGGIFLLVVVYVSNRLRKTVLEKMS